MSSPCENVSLDVVGSQSYHVVSFVSSRDWQKDAAKVEDSWIVVKGKRPKSSVPSLDMNLRSFKGGPKTKHKIISPLALVCQWLIPILGSRTRGGCPFCHFGHSSSW